MKKRNSPIKKSLLFFFLFVVVHPPFHECPRFGGIEFSVPSTVAENHHHENLMTNGEQKSLKSIFSIPQSLAKYPLTVNRSTSCQSIPPLISDLKSSILRC
jgi:hypothetical protein